MNYVTKDNKPMSQLASALCAKAEAAGLELKPLVHGQRIMGTDVVVTDSHGGGLYLCISKSTPFKVSNEGDVLLKAADQGCWIVTVRNTVKDAEAVALVEGCFKLAKKAGYDVLGEVKRGVAAKSLLIGGEDEVVKPVEKVPAKGRRKKAKAKVLEAAATLKA